MTTRSHGRVTTVTYADRYDDPLSYFLRPPPGETPEEQTRRIEAQQEALRISKEIDAAIAEDKKALDRKRKATKLLLLGQSESGKSTTLRNFQLVFAPNHFRRERAAWKTVIQLNLIRSIKNLLDVIQNELDSYQSLQHSPTHRQYPHPPWSSHGQSISGSPPQGRPRSATRWLNDDHRRIRMRLSPLISIEQTLTRKLMPSISEHGSLAATTTSYTYSNATQANSEGVSSTRRRSVQEVCVRAGSGWKGILTKATGNQLHTRTSSDTSSFSGSDEWSEPSEKERVRKGSRPVTGNRDDPTMALAQCKDDIVSLWEDPNVQQVLKKWGVRLREMPGFFLDDVARIATVDYEPTEADVLRARVRTLGVEEHRFTVESGTSRGTFVPSTGLSWGTVIDDVNAKTGSEWYIYDVGGSRSLRASWVPFFDDVQAIIFLAPLAFNLMLEEDPLVNRLEDSVTLWKAVCANPLIAKATLILFLNKMDILDETLKAGVQVKRYVPSFGDQPNELPYVVKYFKDRFMAYHKRLSNKNRPFFCHETSVVNATNTRIILLEVREGLLRRHLSQATLV
ncbi:G-alpha-domain-containing protein [Punctularia strigosozonata HHB-11173 SS5]|uniref:G-alpha-domain-containing protein n=1 Tax=Punctularia strigosozonata (strain HHB-11173) TaxID=741275 RepID=UPI00044186CC|nr:G-alpha-domain-containing protein [Punctularia strigosozonata HHB-11173 SS5]EIN06507.1 G-alpha-domain-containing protein [Punctularia strigosozonata HHB-11173 SS5]